MFDRICLWSHLVLDFCLLENFKSVSISLLVIGLFIFSVSSWFSLWKFSMNFSFQEFVHFFQVLWVGSGSWWWTGKPGVLQFMGSKRVEHDWVTELNWAEEFVHFFQAVHFFGVWLLVVVGHDSVFLQCQV